MTQIPVITIHKAIPPLDHHPHLPHVTTAIFKVRLCTGVSVAIIARHCMLEPNMAAISEDMRMKQQAIGSIVID